jgi:CheY-like chemotaxis protein
MEVSNSEKRLLVLHKNSRISSAVDKVMLYSESDYLKAGVAELINPDLLIMDCQMLGNDYVLICRDLKTDDDLLKIAPIIVATASRPKRVSGPAKSDTALLRPQDIKMLAFKIRKLLATFGFAYLVMNNKAKDAASVSLA